MDSHILEGLTLRLEAAERGLKAARRAMWMGSILVLLAIGGGVWWVSQRLQTGGTPEVLEAQHFVVRDAQGSARAVLEASMGGSTQLVFFRDPLAGEEWRQHSGPGPFSFGARSLPSHSQLVLWDADGDNLQLMTTSLLFGRSDRISMMMDANVKTGGIWLADSSGQTHVLTAGMVADLGKPTASPGSAPKHRRRR